MTKPKSRKVQIKTGDISILQVLESKNNILRLECRIDVIDLATYHCNCTARNECGM